MKKLTVFIFAFLLIAGSAFAGYNGGTQSADAEFTCMVITPLGWEKTADIDLGVVIADGVPRTTFLNGNSIDFTLTGQAGYNCTLTLLAPEISTGDDAGITLVGAWTGDAPLSGGETSFSGNLTTMAATQTYTYTVSSVTAAAGTLSGERVYTLDVSAVYTFI